MNSKRKIIGIVSSVDNKKVTSIVENYAAAINAAGGVTVLLPYTECEEVIASFVEVCDGFCIAGGVDISPERYGEDRHPLCEEPQLYRDALDLAFIERVLESGKPMLAICRGMQMLNVACGGTLFQDIPSECPSEIKHRQTEGELELSHYATPTPKTPLARTVGEDSIRINSFHHQAVKRLGSGLAVMASADDGTVEAIYMPERKFVEGYQWHPERLYAIDENSRKIFRRFIESC
jgi:putative glutamine amidotransferase